MHVDEKLDAPARPPGSVGILPLLSVASDAADPGPSGRVLLEQVMLDSSLAGRQDAGRRDRGRQGPGRRGAGREGRSA